MALIEELCQKGKLFFENGEFLEAIECYEQALLLNPNDPDLWIGMPDRTRYDAL